MSKLPTTDELKRALDAAGSAHHDYETNALRGERDEQWPGWYAAYVLGRLGDFASSSQVTQWLAAAPSRADWTSSAAAHVLAEARRQPTG